jgi:hypothetical protein
MKIVETFDGPYRRLDSSIAQLETPGGCAELMRLGRRYCLIAQRKPLLATRRGEEPGNDASTQGGFAYVP